MTGDEISPIDEKEVEGFCQEISKEKIEHVVVCCMNSHLNNQQEKQVEEIIKLKAPNVKIILSSTMGGAGILERENISIINASIMDFAEKTFQSFRESIKNSGLDCPLYISSNDGTLMLPEKAIQFPVFTFSSGMTNSVRGAFVMTKIKNGFFFSFFFLS